MSRAASSGSPEVILPNLRFRQGARTAATMLALLALAACGGGGSSGTATAPLTVPSTPAGLASTAVTAQSVTLGWSASTGATSYVVRRDGTTLATPSTPAYTDATVGAGTTYAYTVAASNAAGTSAPSPAVSVTTPAPPAAPTGLATSAVSDQAVALTWNASARPSPRRPVMPTPTRPSVRPRPTAMPCRRAARRGHRRRARPSA